jgi:hypothetical protein
MEGENKEVVKQEKMEVDADMDPNENAKTAIVEAALQAIKNDLDVSIENNPALNAANEQNNTPETLVQKKKRKKSKKIKRSINYPKYFQNVSHL